MTLPQIKPVHVSTSKTVDNFSADLAVIFIDEAAIKQGQLQTDDLKSLDSRFGGSLSVLVSLGDFEAKWLQSSVSLAAQQAVAKRIVLVGAGKKADMGPARARALGIKAAELSTSLKAQKVVVIGLSALLDHPERMAQARLGFGLGAYKYPNSNLSAQAKEDLQKRLDVTFVHLNHDCTEAFQQSEILQNAINTCRLLQDGAPNIVTPKYVSEHITTEAKKLGLSVQVWGAQKLRDMGFNAMMAVAGGSANEPQFVVVEYKPDQFDKTLAFVGKGLTMDTGGYSLKSPSTFQEGMKYDMSGAAVSLTSVLAIAQLKLPVHVYGVAALCENMVDANSYRVGDILTSYSGKTIEVIDTDAEGRIVLSDALHYTAKDLKPDFIVEYSTLTGAIIIALGSVGAGVFAFDSDLEKVVMQASETTGERAYPFPVWEEMCDDIKGSISDVCNLGATRRSAGSMTAAAFLNEFTNGVPYAHVDIAGVANDNKAIGYPRKISSGYGVQLSVEIAKQFAGAEKK